MRVVDPKDADPFTCPKKHDVTQRRPESAGIAAIKIDVDDVLVLFRRVLCVLDRTVGPPVEPLRMVLKPRMVWRTLDREVESDLEAIVARGGNKAAEILQRAELRVDRIVPSLGRSNRVRTANILRARGQRVVAALTNFFARWGGSEGNKERRTPFVGQTAGD